MNFLNKVLKNSPIYNPAYIVAGFVTIFVYALLCLRVGAWALLFLIVSFSFTQRFRKWGSDTRPELNWSLAPGYVLTALVLALVSIPAYFVSPILAGLLLFMALPSVLVGYFIANARLAQS